MNNFPEVNPEFALSVPFSRKDELKKRFKLRWSPTSKLWHAPNRKTYDNCELVPYHIVNLKVTYAKKELAKELGARWNGSNWYCSKSQFESNKSKFQSCIFDSDNEEEDEDGFDERLYKCNPGPEHKII